MTDALWTLIVSQLFTPFVVVAALVIGFCMASLFIAMIGHIFD